jgi:cyanate permease
MIDMTNWECGMRLVQQIQTTEIVNVAILDVLTDIPVVRYANVTNFALKLRQSIAHYNTPIYSNLYRIMVPNVN